MNLFFIRRSRLTVSIFFLCALVLGLFIYKDFNIHQDAHIERLNGLISIRYLADIFHLDRLKNTAALNAISHFPNLPTYIDRDYPVGFNLPLVAIEIIFKLNDSAQIYSLRNLLTFLIFLAGTASLYSIIQRRYASWKYGLLACLFLMLSPRIFADAFYNNKDLVFLSLFLIATNTLAKALLNPSSRNIALHAVATTLAMDIRIMAIIIPMLTVSILGIKWIKQELTISQLLRACFLYLALTAIFLYISWPWLWENPFEHLLLAFSNMAHFRWVGQLRYLGNLIPSTQLPWHYLPVWIGITTPLLYLALFFIGALATLKVLVLRHWRLWNTNEELQDLIFLVICVVPVLAVVLLRSVLYDGWRHMYFIYPALLMVAMKGWFLVWTWAKSKATTKYLAAIALTACLANTAFWMIKAHPLQNVYFNTLAGKNWKENFDVDYWGLANRQALEYILAHDQSNSYINLFAGSFTSLWLSFDTLPKNDRGRFGVVEKIKDTDYIVTNYRLNLTNYASKEFDLLHHITVDNEVIVSIYKRTDEALARDPQTVNQGRVIRFTESDLGRLLLVRGGGWNTPEIWGTWSKNNHSKIIFKLGQNRPNKMTLTLRAMVNARYPEQRLRIGIDRHAPTEFVLTKDSLNTINLDIPRELKNSGFFTLNFYFDNPIQPKDIGAGTDDRYLSIGLMSVSFQ